MHGPSSRRGMSLLSLMVVAMLWAAVTSPAPRLARAQGGESPSGGERQPSGRGAGLHVVFSAPQGTRTTGTGEAVLVTFDRPMVPLGGAVSALDHGPLGFEPALAGTYRWLGTRTLEFRPARLPSATAFRATVPAGTSAADGTRLATGFSWTFESGRPSLLATLPGTGDRWIRPGEPIVLRFNQPMDPARAAEGIRLAGTTAQKQKHEPKIAVRSLRGDEARRLGAPHYLSYETGEEDRRLERPDWPADCTIVVEPKEPLRRGASYVLTIGAGLRAREGSLGTSKRHALAFSTVGAFAFRGFASATKQDANDPVSFEFTNPVHPKDLARRVRFVPPVRLQSSMDGDRSRPDPSLPFVLEPRTRYQVEISPDLTDAFGNRLGRPVRATLVTADYEPRVLAPLGLRSLEADLDPDFPVALLNTSPVRVRAARLEPEEIVPTLEAFQDGRHALPRRTLLDRVLPPPPKPNRMQWLPVSLAPALSQGHFGQVVVHVGHGNAKRSEATVHNIGNPYDGHGGTAYVQATSLGLTGKFSPENTLLWVTSLRDASPVAGAQVQLRSASNKVVWSGSTDASGRAVAPGPGRAPRSEHGDAEPRLYAFVTKGPDVAVVSSAWGSTVWPGAFGIRQAYEAEKSLGDIHVFTDRGLYRPGDTVHLKGIVRVRRGDAWGLPSEKSLKLRVMDSRYTEVLAREVPISATGAFDLDVKLEAGAPTGAYRIELPPGFETEGAPVTGFRVEAYRPAQFEVQVEAARPECVAGDPLSARIAARHLFGAPLPGAKIDWSVTATPMAFEPAGWSEFTFGVDPWLEAEREDEERSALRVIKAGSGVLDKEGRLAVDAPTRLTGARGTVRATVEGRVTGPDGSILAGRSSVLVHRSMAHLGVRMPSSFVQVGKSVPLHLVAVSSDGTAQPGGRIHLSLVRREWQSVRRLSRSGGTEWQSVPRDQVVLTTDVTAGAKEVAAELPVKAPGFYFVQARTTDSKGCVAETRRALWAWGEGQASWERPRDDRLALVSDRRSYAPGDTARVMIQSPFAKARALVTVERDTVVRHFVQEVEGSTPVIPLPVVEADAPNVFVSVVLVQGRTGTQRFDAGGEDLAKPAFRMGYVRIPVDAKAHRLQVDIAPDHEHHRPGDTVTVDLTVRDAEGHGREAEVTLVAADLGVLNLIDYHVPDPFRTFFAERLLGVRTSETLHQVIGQRRYGEKGRPGGGGGPGAGGDVAGSYRWQFDATATWQPSLRTDASGHVRATFKLPDSVTSFRLTAIAHTADSRFGRSEKRIVARKPLMLTAAWPRLCRFGDRGTLGVVVHNQGEQEGDARVKLQLTGAKLEGADERTVHLKPGQSAPVRFPFEATTAGRAAFRFDASLGSETDGVKADIPVALPRLLSTTATAESTEDSVTIPVDVPKDVIPGTGRLELALASSGLAGLRSCLEYLQGYGYECLEQKVSRVMPIVLARDVVEAFGLKSGEVAYGRSLVQGVLGALPSHQGTTGGLSLWPGGRPSPYATAYAMVLAARAKEQGHTVAPAFADAAVAYMKRALVASSSGDEDWPYPYSEKEMLATRAYLLHALSLWGIDDPAAFSLLYERRADLPVFGQAMLLKVAAHQASRPATSAGKPPSLAAERGELRRMLLNGLRANPTTAWFEAGTADQGWIYESRTRATAVLLETLMESGEDFPQASLVARWLVEQGRSGCWRTTQENASAFAALSAYFRRFEAAPPDFTAEVRLSGREILREAFRGRDLQITSRTVPIGEETGAAPLRVGKTGQGRLYLGARLRYASRAATPPLDAGMDVVKIVEPAEGAKMDADGTYPTGTLLKVTLVVGTPEARRFVVLDDPVGGGFEVLHTDFETERKDLADLLRSDRDPQRWWGSFDHFEVYDDRVLLFADLLEPGPHRYSYFVRATYPGRYSVPATQVEQMYEPEVFGRTGQGEVTIR